MHQLSNDETPLFVVYRGIIIHSWVSERCDVDFVHPQHDPRRPPRSAQKRPSAEVECAFTEATERPAGDAPGPKNGAGPGKPFCFFGGVASKRNQKDTHRLMFFSRLPSLGF